MRNAPDRSGQCRGLGGVANKFKGSLRWGSRGRGDELACSKGRVVGP